MKIKANGATEVARWEAFKTIDGGTYRYLFVMRSTGVLLGKVVPGGTYHRKATVSPEAMRSGDYEAMVERWLASKGFHDVKWMMPR